jgi:4-hydroxybenzoate polyprenyltransferase
MGKRIIEFTFYGNYFVGLLAIALSLETSIQLHIPFCSAAYYLLLFSVTVFYYTYAYTGVLQSPSTANLRSQWYRQHSNMVLYSQWILAAVAIALGVWMLVHDFGGIVHLRVRYWLTILIILLCSVLYYGLLPRSVFNLNLRRTGWLKAFVIGFVWAGCASLLPLIVLHVESAPYTADIVIVAGLFIKNWMFCTVNAIMFDLKDYEDDSNKHLKTFVVRFGLHRTISFILIPLILIGMASTILFTGYRHLGWAAITILLLPFLLLLIVSYTMYRPRSILYYLVVIDGLVLIKAVCGIIAMQLVA